MATSTSPIPAFYRVVFLYIDPMFCTLGAVMHLLQVEDTLRGYSPVAPLPATTAVLHVFDTLAGFFLFLGTAEAILLRARAHDPQVWRIFQGAAAWVDVLMVFGAVRALAAEGRLYDVAGWRGDDWRLVAGNISAGAMRLACALGLGMQPSTKGKRA